MDPHPRVIVLQMGARHNYAIARMLHERGALAALCTDLTWLPAINRGSGLRQTAETRYPQLARRSTGLPDELVWSFPEITMIGGLLGCFSATLRHGAEDWLLGTR